MDYSVRHYPGYGYGPAHGRAPSGPSILSWQRYGVEVCTLRVWDQTK
jgi:hypothetical protein